VTFEQEDDDVLAHHIILMFLALAFLDDAFEDVSTPQELYSKRNPRSGDLLTRFKDEKKPIPILRRLEAIGSRKLSPTLAWSTGSATNECQRICIISGFPQRFTLYNIRRGVANSVDGESVPHQQYYCFSYTT
jgi:hypothetical protein